MRLVLILGIGLLSGCASARIGSLSYAEVRFPSGHRLAPTGGWGEIIWGAVDLADPETAADFADGPPPVALAGSNGDIKFVGGEGKVADGRYHFRGYVFGKSLLFGAVTEATGLIRPDPAVEVSFRSATGRTIRAEGRLVRAGEGGHHGDPEYRRTWEAGDK